MEKVIGMKLKKAREEINLSQGAFAKVLGLSSEYISLLEAGKRTPSLDTLRRLAVFLNKDISYFFEEKEIGFAGLFGDKGLDDRMKKVLKSFRTYCEEYLRLEELTGRRLELAPLYSHLSPERLADEERRRLALGDGPIRDVFGLIEMNGLRVLRLPIPEDSKVSGLFIFLEEKKAAFALINSAEPTGRQAFIAAHEYCHYLKDRLESPIIDNPDVYIDEYASLYHPREPFAQAFAARFLMPPARVREIAAKEFAGGRLSFEDVLYLKRYFGVSTAAMLRSLRNLGLLGRAKFEDYFKLEASGREKELFGNIVEEGEGGWFGRLKKKALPSDRFKLLSREASRKS